MQSTVTWRWRACKSLARKSPGATAVGIAFGLPSFLIVLALSAADVRFGGLKWMQGLFYGVGAAVIGIIARSAFKLTKLTLGKDKFLWAIFFVLAVSTAWTSRGDSLPLFAQ